MHERYKSSNFEVILRFKNCSRCQTCRSQACFLANSTVLCTILELHYFGSKKDYLLLLFLSITTATKSKKELLKIGNQARKNRKISS